MWQLGNCQQKWPFVPAEERANGQWGVQFHGTALVSAALLLSKGKVGFIRVLFTPFLNTDDCTKEDDFDVPGTRVENPVTFGKHHHHDFKSQFGGSC